MFEAGKKYNVKVSGYGLVEGNNGARPYIEFEGEAGKISYYGNINSEKAQEFTVKNFVIAGFQGDDWSDLQKPLMFDGRELMIETESYEGKVKVKYINKARKEFTGQAPKMAGIFAKVKLTLGEKANKPKPSTDDVF